MNVVSLNALIQEADHHQGAPEGDIVEDAGIDRATTTTEGIREDTMTIGAEASAGARVKDQ